MHAPRINVGAQGGQCVLFEDTLQLLIHSDVYAPQELPNGVVRDASPSICFWGCLHNHSTANFWITH